MPSQTARVNDTVDEATQKLGSFWSRKPSSRADESTELALPRRALDVSRYDLGEVVGEGGMGRVLLAKDRALERAVAVKMLWAPTDDDRKRFVRECAIAGRLEHPNIVPLYDAGVDGDGKPYLAMRYIEGQTLRDVVTKLRANDAATMKRFSLEARCRVALQLLSALEFAHARGILHRDIKPENVMVGPFDEVLLVDWGIACTPEESAHESQRGLGTLRYMSPEQAHEDALDARSDLYSLSVLLYELFTLEHPIGVIGDARAVIAIAERVPKDAELLRTPGHSVVPRALSLVIMKGLEKSRDARWPSSAAMARAIEAVLAGDAPIVCPHTAYARGLTAVGRVLDRFPRVTYLATAVILALAGVGIATVAGAVADLVRSTS
jgi:serine/threonine protein kinase